MRTFLNLVHSHIVLRLVPYFHKSHNKYHRLGIFVTSWFPSFNKLPLKKLKVNNSHFISVKKKPKTINNKRNFVNLKMKTW